jgi:TPR repeat protein
MRMNDSARVYFDELVQMEMTEMDADQMTGMNFFISSYAATFGLCDLADEYYQKASASGNYDSSVLTSIALCHAGNGNKDEAIRYMELSLKHGDPVYYNVACVYSALKDEKNAVLNFESFLKKQKNTVPYKHILTDPDIEFLRTLKQFNVLMKKYFPEHQK